MKITKKSIGLLCVLILAPTLSTSTSCHPQNEVNSDTRSISWVGIAIAVVQKAVDYAIKHAKNEKTEKDLLYEIMDQVRSIRKEMLNEIDEVKKIVKNIEIQRQLGEFDSLLRTFTEFKGRSPSRNEYERFILKANDVFSIFTRVITTQDPFDASQAYKLARAFQLVVPLKIIVMILMDYDKSSILEFVRDSIEYNKVLFGGFRMPGRYPLVWTPFTRKPDYAGYDKTKYGVYRCVEHDNCFLSGKLFEYLANASSGAQEIDFFSEQRLHYIFEAGHDVLCDSNVSRPNLCAESRDAVLCPAGPYIGMLELPHRRRLANIQTMSHSGRYFNEKCRDRYFNLYSYDPVVRFVEEGQELFLTLEQSILQGSDDHPEYKPTILTPPLSSRSGKIEFDGDRDVFVVDLAAAGEFSVMVNGEPNLEFKVTGPNAPSTSYHVDGPELTMDAVPGTYTIKIWHREKTGRGAYQIFILFQEK